jgi:hypothetical protein
VLLCQQNAQSQLLLFIDDRCLHIFWWEPLVAAYFVLAPAAVAWSIIGLTWAAKSADARHGGISRECVSSQVHALLDQPYIGKAADGSLLLPARGDCRGRRCTASNFATPLFLPNSSQC